MKVAFTMIHYPVAMGRYILEALLRRPDTEVWTAGPTTGRWIPWAGGMNLPESYVREPDFGLPLNSGNPIMSYEVVQANCPFKPDLWLEVNAGLKPVGRPDGLYAIVGTDPHVLNYSPLRRQCDHFFCMQKPYMVAGDHWLPYAYDPIWHSGSPIPFEDREYDAALIGLAYQNRKLLVHTLRASGLNVYFELGPAYDDARTIYHNTKVGFNWSSLRDTTARVFELMALGVVPVLNRVPDLVEMFDDRKDFIGFDRLPQAVDAIQHALANPDESRRIINNATEAVRPHTWDARVTQILETVGLE